MDLKIHSIKIIETETGIKPTFFIAYIDYLLAVICAEQIAF
jgi:hypothetical protein